MTEAAANKLRYILNAPSQRFFRTTDTSLMQYLLLLFSELKDKAEAEEEAVQAMWYADAACLVLEVMIRYEGTRIKETKNL